MESIAIGVIIGLALFGAWSLFELIVTRAIWEYKKRKERGIMKDQKGFTLIELLVVVAILGILAAVIVPNVAGFIKTGQNTAADAETAAVQTAVDAVMAASGKAELAEGTFSADADYSITVGENTYKVSDYVRQPFTDVKGTYSIGTNGLVTQTDDGY